MLASETHHTNHNTSKDGKRLSKKIFERSHRFFKRRRRLMIKDQNKNHKLKIDVKPFYHSEDDCLGDSEKSDDEHEDESNNNIRRDSSSFRRQCAITRQCLAQDQLENKIKGDLVCLTCHLTFSNIQNLRRHLRLHLKRDSNIAEVDDEDCDQSRKLSCDFCPELFVNKSAFQTHLKLHGDCPELICHVCDKKYSDKYALRYHLRTHGFGLQIKCELCGKCFTKQSKLKTHIETFHENVRKFQCLNCDKAFKAKTHLDQHMLQHSGEKPFSCTDCGESFRHKVSLTAHMRIHSDSRPYVCEKCGKMFRDNSTLQTHKRVHSGEKPYKCNICHKSFSQRAGLNYHKTVHSGLKPHQCNQCEYSTAKKASLHNHIKTIHKEELTVQPGPLPSPPSQRGDQVMIKDGGGLSNSLPSFNILKSYNSSSLHETIVDEPNKDHISSYESHSDPSLSPPLTPPISGYRVSMMQKLDFKTQILSSCIVRNLNSIHLIHSPTLHHHHHSLLSTTLHTHHHHSECHHLITSPTTGVKCAMCPHILT